MKGKSLLSYGPRGRRSSEERTLHDLNNLLGALRLRVDIMTKDATCMWAQGANLQAISRIVDDALENAGKLERRQLAARNRRRRVPR
jgi:hypothetical protein